MSTDAITLPETTKSDLLTACRSERSPVLSWAGGFAQLMVVGYMSFGAIICFGRHGGLDYFGPGKMMAAAIISGAFSIVTTAISLGSICLYYLTPATRVYYSEVSSGSESCLSYDVSPMYPVEHLEGVLCQVCGTCQPGPWVACRLCETPHHADCFVYNCGCSTYGCGELVADKCNDGSHIKTLKEC